MISEYTHKEPITILNSERYNYYKECEKKANFTDEQIREEATKMFKQWSEKTDFKVDINMLDLRKTMLRHSVLSFSCEWDKQFVSSDKLNDFRFVFEDRLNEDANVFVSEVYKEHRKELEEEFDARVSERQKSYDKLKKMLGLSVLAIGLLFTASVIMITKLI